MRSVHKNLMLTPGLNTKSTVKTPEKVTLFCCNDAGEKCCLNPSCCCVMSSNNIQLISGLTKGQVCLPGRQMRWWDGNHFQITIPLCNWYCQTRVQTISRSTLDAYRSSPTQSLSQIQEVWTWVDSVIANIPPPTTTTTMKLLGDFQNILEHSRTF